MKTPESYEKQAIKKYLDSIGAWHFSPMMTGYGKSGVPDIVVCLRGHFIGVEVKRENKSPTERQWKIMEAIHNACGTCFYGTAAVVIPSLKQYIEDNYK